MPRAKKLAGTAVDQRNGQRATLPQVGGLRRFALPKRSDGNGYDLRTRRMWAALWSDPVSGFLAPVDRELVVRWAQGVDDWLRSMEAGRAEPVVLGSVGQPVKSPHFDIARDAMVVVSACEQQIGVGALNRARLGVAVVSEALSLDELNSRIRRPDDAPKRPDPRVIQGIVLNPGENTRVPGNFAGNGLDGA